MKNLFFLMSFLIISSSQAQVTQISFFKTEDGDMWGEKFINTQTNYYKKFVPKAKPQTTNSKGETFILSSMDINHSIATLHGHVEQLSNDTIHFTHMKSKVQNVDNIGLNWTDSIPFYMTDDLELKVGNFRQQGIFHYTENKFCKDVIKKYESKVL